MFAILLNVFIPIRHFMKARTYTRLLSRIAAMQRAGGKAMRVSCSLMIGMMLIAPAHADEREQLRAARQEERAAIQQAVRERQEMRRKRMEERRANQQEPSNGEPGLGNGGNRRLTPEERQALRREILEAGRNGYPQNGR